MNINASELGNSFVQTCFQLFQGGGIFLYLTVLCLVLLLIFDKEKWKSFLGGYSLFLLLVAFNPFLIWHVVRILGLDDEYYRFLWLIPVAVIVGYIGTKVTLRPFRKWQQGLLFAVMLCIIAFCGKTIFSRPMGLIENIYKIPDEVIEICEIIRADSPKDEPCVAADFDLDVLINQYAPEIDLILSYRELAEIKELESFGEYRDAPSNRLKYVLIDGTVHDEGYLIYALTEGQVDYIVTQRGAPAREYILASQCRLIAELEQYCIFRVEIEES